MGVFAKIVAPVGCPQPPPAVRDLFLHALFARIAMTDNSVIEFQTRFNPATNTIELEVPACNLPIFDMLTGMQKGPNFKAFMGWANSGSGGGTGGLIDSDLVVAGNSASTTEQVLATLTVPGGSVEVGSGVRIRAWGTFNSNNQTKTVNIYYGSAVIATNDITVKPNGLTWKLDADVYLRAVGAQEAISTGLIGAVSQSATITSLSEDETQDVIVEVTGQTLTPTPNNIVCNGLVLEAI